MTTLAAIGQAAPVLATNSISKSYGSRLALSEVSLNVYAGQIVALLGPNGAGKSTLIQILSGLFSPDKGSLSILGHDMRTQAATALAGLGIVFQQSSLDLDLSVLANLQFHSDLHGIAKQEAAQRIAKGLARHGLSDQSKVAVRALSGGNRRKVELIRALLHQPRLLLMDEPTVGLDPASRRELMSAVEELARYQGVAVLWATHLVDEVQSASRLLVLNQGRIVFDGLSQDLIAQLGAQSLEQAFLDHCKATASVPGGPKLHP